MSRRPSALAAMLAMVMTSALTALTFGTAGAVRAQSVNTSGAPYWRGWDMARAVVLRHTGPGGYVVDGWGGLHAFGGAPTLTGTRYTRGHAWVVGAALQGNDTGGVVITDRAVQYRFGTLGATPNVGVVPKLAIEGISLDPTPVTGPPVSYDVKGATVDAEGTIHPFTGSPALDTTGAPFWKHLHIARGLAITQDGAGGITGGFVLDGWGGVHAFGHAHLTSATPYWRGWDIARDIAVDGHGNGVVIDGWGGLHTFTYAVS